MKKSQSGGVIEAESSRQMGRYKRTIFRQIVYTRGDEGTGVRCRT